MKSASPLTTLSWTVTRSFLAALWMFDFQEAPVSVLWPWAKNYSALTWATHEESLLSTKKTKLWRRRSAETKSQVKTTRQHASSTAVEGLIHSVTLIRTQLAHFAFGWKPKISQDLPWQGLSATKSPRGSVLLLSQVSKVKKHLLLSQTLCAEILELDLCKEDRFIVIASDGVWDYISNDEIAKIVKPFFDAKNAEKAAEAVVKESYLRWKREEEGIVDDITCVIIFLDVKLP